MPGNIDRNFEKVLSVVESHEGDLYVFPEMFLVGYTSQDIIYRLSMTLNSDYVEELIRISERRKCTIVIGFPELCELGYLYNSALIASMGRAYVYRKRHLPTFSIFDEHRWFKPFSGPIEPIDLGFAKIGVAICYDMFFPEIFKAYALRGAKIMVVISASPDTSVPLFHALAKARAIETTSFVIWVNNAGVLEGVTFGGGSIAVAPLGEVIVELARGEEDVKVIELDLKDVYRARIARPVIRDSSISDVLELLRSYSDMERGPRALESIYRNIGT